MPDTEAARDDLRIARQYIDKTYDKNEPKNTFISNLDYALKYINRARAKDPDATLKARSSTSADIITWTSDLLEGEVFAIRGMNESQFDESQDGLAVAVKLLEHSINLFPMPQSYAALARSYIKMARRDDAHALLQDGARRWPGDMQIQPLIDGMESDPTWGRSIYRSPNDLALHAANRNVFILKMTALVLVIAFIVYLYR
jgi:tetratricopeptide (TPR) repeat protein